MSVQLEQAYKLDPTLPKTAPERYSGDQCFLHIEREPSLYEGARFFLS